MAERRDYIALDWIATEVGDTLRRATVALDSYRAQPQDLTQLRFCLSHVHSVRGSLRMVAMPGAGLWAEEIEAVLQALLAGQIPEAIRDDAIAAVGSSLGALPAHLDRLRREQKDHPAALLSPINDLRAVRNTVLVTEGVVFNPQALAVAEAGAPAADLAALAPKLRQMYQLALLNYLRGIDPRDNLNYLAKVFARLAKLTAGADGEPLWQVGIALCEGLLNRSITLGAAVKLLLRQLDGRLKLLADGTGADVPPALLKNLLYYVATSAADSKFIRGVKARHGLAGALPEPLSADGQSGWQQIEQACGHQLHGIATQLAQGETSRATLVEIKRARDAVALLGHSDIEARLQGLIRDWHMVDTGAAMNRLAQEGSDLAALAERLGEALPEPRQDEPFNGSEEAQQQLDGAFGAVLRESRNGLEQAKEAIIEFVANQWRHQCLEEVPQLLTDVRGSLTLAGHGRAAEVLEACERYVGNELLNKRQIPAWQLLDTLADAVASVDYYLERLGENPNADCSGILDVAEDSIARLCSDLPDEPAQDMARIIPFQRPGGKPSDDLPPAVPFMAEDAARGDIGVTGEEVETAIVEPSGHDQNATAEALATTQELPAQGEPSTTPFPEESALEPSTDEERLFDTETSAGQAQSADAEPSAEEEPSAEKEPSAEQEPSVEKEQLSTQAEPSLTADVPAVDAGRTDESDIEPPDPEIVEIFIEEAGEVLETLAEHFPVWAADYSAGESLVTVRRAFHTLKGSGRMVGANDIGELAWSIENMLNRLMDGAVVADVQRIETISSALELIPAMVAAFEAGRRFPMAAVEAVMARAVSLAREQNPTLTGAPGFVAETSEPVGTAADTSTSGEAKPSGAGAPPSFAPQSGNETAPFADGAGEAPSTAIGDSDGPDRDGAADAYEPETDGRDVQDDRDDGGDGDAQLLEIFAIEAASHLDVLGAFITHGRAAPIPVPLSDELQRTLHTLKGSAHMAAVEAVARAITPVERLVKELRSAQHSADPAVLTILEQALQLVEQALAQTPGDGKSEQMEIDLFCETVDAVLRAHMQRVEQDEAEGRESVSSQTIGRFLEDAAEGLTSCGDYLQAWREDRLVPGREPPLADTLERIAAGAESAGLAAVAELASALRPAVENTTVQPPPTDEFFALAGTAVDRLIDMLDQLAAEQQPQPDDELLRALRSFDWGGTEVPVLDEPADAGELPPLAGAAARSSAQFDGGGWPGPDLEAAPEPGMAEISPEPAPEPESAVASSEDADHSALSVPEPDDEADEVDAEILEIFLEEAEDLLEALDTAVHQWMADRGNEVYIDELQRLLHTFKGGARLAGLRNAGDLAHDFETLLLQFQQLGTAVDDQLLATVQQHQDQLVRCVEAVKAGGDVADRQTNDGYAAVDAGESDRPTSTLPTTVVGAADTGADIAHQRYEGLAGRNMSSIAAGPDVTGTVVPFVSPAPASGSAPAVPPSGGGSSSAVVQVAPDGGLAFGNVPTAGAMGQQLRRGPQEVIKIPAQQLEQLVNLAGETSIARSRTEEQVNEFVHSLDEMQITVDRLQEQVRRLDLETEAQVLFRREQVGSDGLEGFDPLEFDRYSLLQQLSRSLLESASDLVDLKSTLADKARDMETLLVQQSRINTELQEGLMRSRMVPFARMVPRLRRIVRQVAGELGKDVEFYVDNAEGEMDRSVLERVVAPLEHMLRNAVDHGIEPADERAAAGKGARGSIVLGLSREGGEVVLTLTDDGRGIDLAAVRRKAIDRGLMAEEASLSDYEILQFILQAGFSTAREVTQISGRGVGMDVVYSEIKQLGGSLEIDSEHGQGTRFTVRLPFTVSVNRALMVSAGGDIYAIPLNTIEGIVRVSPFELEAYYQPDAPLFEYAGQPYLMRYMGALLRSTDKPQLEGQAMPLPVVLVRATDHADAVQVDGLLGSREIVVKTLGPQFAQVQGLSGATVLGDGSVVVILDLLAMIRADASQLHRDVAIDQPALAGDRSRPLLVMVVDDSVTVRKVTSRFLEREGMEVLLARDGVDAISLLNETERVPDIMLLDIEMPRMDGFEVASRVRHTSRLQDIPIIMITSRTGDKHRERAYSLGVNKYLGKPYQESVLLQTIQELTGAALEV